MYKFEKDERVLCFHGPLIYEAKILKLEFWDSATYGDQAGPHYFVHYKGWKQTWDEWVPESRVMKLDEENLQLQKELQQTYGSAAAKKDAKDRSKGGSSSFSTSSLLPGNGDTSPPVTSKKRQRDGATEREDDWARKPEVKISLPDGLKARLVDDWEYITKCQRLVSLPRVPCVTVILDQFRDYKVNHRVKDTNFDMDQLDEVINGLKLYFDKALGTVLLYRYERQQYAETLRKLPGERMCNIYGVEHLVRLFVQLPFLIVHTTMDKDTISFLKDQISQIINFIEKRADGFFLSEYENAPAEYLQYFS